MAVKRLPRWLFFLSARLVGEACLELFIWRITPEGVKQVYLIPRPKNDPFWPGMLHLPGVRKIPSERDGDHLRRALSETPYRHLIGNVKYLFSNTYPSARGTVYKDVRSLRVDYRAIDRDFYDVKHLPKGIINHQDDVIRRCVESTY